MHMQTVSPTISNVVSVPAFHLEAVLRLADNALVLAQRTAEWCGHGPVLEEDIALANIGLDLLGQARLLYSHAGALEGKGRDEDALAYWRDEHEFRNHALCELPNALRGSAKHDDYAVTIVRNLLFYAYALSNWQALVQSTDKVLAGVAEKAVKETITHWRHAQDWTIRLGDGTDVSKQRMQAALNHLWPYARELFTDDATDQAAAQAGLCPLPSTHSPAWQAAIAQVLQEAGLQQPPDSEFLSHGKQGAHTESLSYLLAEMQSLARAHPGATW
jgi:ring-1,2-phenylacetyl-CoA epoxidase subunit PaaC